MMCFYQTDTSHSLVCNAHLRLLLNSLASQLALIIAVRHYLWHLGSLVDILHISQEHIVNLVDASENPQSTPLKSLYRETCFVPSNIQELQLGHLKRHDLLHQPMDRRYGLQKAVEDSPSLAS